jgi:hypothetical protein
MQQDLTSSGQTPDTKPMPTLKVRASLVKVAETARADCDIRYYLRGILVEPRKEGGAYIIASNGYHLIACIDPNAEVSEPVLIKPTKATMAFCPKIHAKGEMTYSLSLVDFQGKPALMVSDESGMPLHVQVSEAIIELGLSKFPQWRRVLPDFTQLKRGMRSEVNPDLLVAPFSAFRSTPSAFSPKAMDMWQVPSDHPTHDNIIVQRINGRDDILHLIMPRLYDDKSLVWISLWSTPKNELPKP